MAALIAVAGVNACADETVADVHAAAQGGFHIRAVVGIHIHRIVSTGFLGGIDELTHHFIGVRAAGVLGANGDLLFGAVQSVTHTAHIHGNGFCHPSGNGCRAAVTYFLVNGDVHIGLAAGHDAVVAEVLGKAQQDANAQLVIQKTALEIAAWGATGTGLEAHNVTHLDAQLFGIVGRADILVQHHFHSVERPFCIGILSVYMDRGVTQLASAVDDLAGAGVDPHIFRFAVVGVHAAERGKAQAAVALYSGNHCTQGIGMRLQKQGVLFVYTAQVYKHTALGGDAGCKAQAFKFFLYPSGGTSGVATGGIDGKQCFRHFPCVFCIILSDHRSYLLKGFSSLYHIPKHKTRPHKKVSLRTSDLRSLVWQSTSFVAPKVPRGS